MIQPFHKNKILLLLRHSEYQWKKTNVIDFDKPLTEKGMYNARKMGYLLLKLNTVPDRIISSPAKRAASTAEIVKLYRINKNKFYMIKIYIKLLKSYISRLSLLFHEISQ